MPSYSLQVHWYTNKLEPWIIMHVPDICIANICTTHTTVCNHTHLGLKVDIRFQSDEDFVWLTMANNCCNIILDYQWKAAQKEWKGLIQWYCHTIVTDVSPMICSLLQLQYNNRVYWDFSFSMRIELYFYNLHYRHKASAYDLVRPVHLCDLFWWVK